MYDIQKQEVANDPFSSSGMGEQQDEALCQKVTAPVWLQGHSRRNVQKLINVITKGKIFGYVQCHVYSIEWKKRGLFFCAHSYLVERKAATHQIDDIISSEILNLELDENLYNTVMKNTVHGPCGACDPVSSCMKNEKCTKKFPQQLIKETVHDDKTYLLHRRRAPEDDGSRITVQARGGVLKVFEVTLVVPYSLI
ncbi:helitron_like_N domain-containing protein [Trichonephila clavipes]|nr:helitron_like_N domain-containing protein [Trichonephila clavipes]